MIIDDDAFETSNYVIKLSSIFPKSLKFTCTNADSTNWTDRVAKLSIQFILQLVFSHFSEWI